VPRTAGTIDLAVGERCDGPSLRRRAGHRLDRRTAPRRVRAIGKRAGLGAVHTAHADESSRWRSGQNLVLLASLAMVASSVRSNEDGTVKSLNAPQDAQIGWW
jgi:hypothetical protein